MPVQTGIQAVVRQAQALVFDFDGTLVDSNEIKWRGFEVVFAEFPEKIDEIMRYCRSANHTIRGEKFRHVYESILGRPYTLAEAGRCHERYEAATTSAIVGAPEIPGAGPFLHGLSRRITSAVLSSTPDELIRTILRERGWRELFAHVQGAPVDKAAWLRQFTAQQASEADRVVFFGDTQEDAEAGRLAGCTFVGVANPELAGPERLWMEDFWALIFEE